MLYADHTWHLDLIPVTVKCVLGRKRDGMTKGEKELHNEELHDLYCLPNIVRVSDEEEWGWAWRVARTGDMRGSCRDFVGNPEGKRPLGRPSRRWGC